MKKARDVADFWEKIKNDEASARARGRPFSTYSTYGRKQEALIDVARIPSFLIKLHETYLRADALARYHQIQTRRTLRLLFSLGFLSAAAFELYAHHDRLPHAVTSMVAQWIPGSLFLGLWFLILLCYGWARWWRQYQENFRSYRALAEGLRVQFFWLLVGVRDPIGAFFEEQDSDEGEQDSDETLPVLKVIEDLGTRARQELADRQDVEVSIVTDPGFGLVTRLALTDRNEIEQRAVDALHRWVAAQEAYFDDTANSEERWRIRLKTLEQVLFWPALALVLASLPLPGQEKTALIVPSALAMVAAGLLHGYVEKRAFGEHVESYRRARLTFRDRERDIRNALARRDFDGAQDRFREIGKVALSENGDWVRLHRWKPLEPPLR